MQLTAVPLMPVDIGPQDGWFAQSRPGWQQSVRRAGRGIRREHLLPPGPAERDSLRLLIRPFHARPRIHQNQAVAITNQINIRPQTRKGLHGKVVDVTAVTGDEFLDFVHGGLGDWGL